MRGAFMPMMVFAITAPCPVPDVRTTGGQQHPITTRREQLRRSREHARRIGR